MKNASIPVVIFLILMLSGYLHAGDVPAKLQALDTITLISPTDHQRVSYASTGGNLSFMFSKIPGASRYVLHFHLYDIMNDHGEPVAFDLVPPGNASGASTGSPDPTPGFSETILGMVYALSLDETLWNELALYDIKWGMEAYDSAGTLIASTFQGGVYQEYVKRIKLIASNAVLMTAPLPGTTLYKADGSPEFAWEAYPGSGSYSLLLARKGPKGLDPIIQQDNLTLNLLTMTTSTWEAMAEGTWYWTVLGYDTAGSLSPSGFTILDFTVQAGSLPPVTPALSVDKTNIAFQVGDSETVTISGGTGFNKLSSSDTQVAAAVMDTLQVVITGVSVGTAVITITDNSGSQVKIAVIVSPVLADCNVSLSSVSGNFSAAGESQDITVTVSNAGCTWTVTDIPSWVTVNPGGGTGSDTITLTVDENTDPVERTGTVIIAEETYAIIQKGMDCSASLSSVSGNFSATGESQDITVIVPNAGCTWTVTDIPSWVTVNPDGGTGSDTVTLTVDENTDPVERTGTVTIAEEIYVIIQKGIDCSTSLSSVSGNFSAAGESQDITVTVSNAGCTWTVTDIPSWVTVNPGGGTGSDIVTLTVDENTDPVERTGTVTIATETFSIIQGKGPTPSIEKVSILSPGNREVLSYEDSNGNLTFKFGKMTGTAKYILHLELHDIWNQSTIPIPIDLVPMSGSTSTPGFYEDASGMMVVDLPVDEQTWDVLAEVDLKWGIEAYDNFGSLVGSTHDGASFVKYLNRFNLTAANGIALVSPAPGAVLSQTVGSPVFQWEPYQGAVTYSLNLVRLTPVGFDEQVIKDNLIQNQFILDDATWQSMPEGTWYWTVAANDWSGNLVSSGVSLFDFTLISGGYQCGAYVAEGVWKEFDCYNLAAVGRATNDDPFTPTWRLIGGYWQWGRKGPDAGQWQNTNTPHFAHGPTGPGSSEANEGTISGWDGSDALDGAWSDASKTANDPCPSGFRVPTNAQWDGVLNNNTQSTVGTWSSSYSDHTNYSAARFFGNDLMLPAAGYRSNDSGALSNRGLNGYYWSSLEYGSYYARLLYFYSGNAFTNLINRGYGFSVRCVAE